MASPMPGTSRSHTAAVASGVTSRGPSPVPPVVTQSATSDAAASVMAASMRGRSSGTTAALVTL